MDFYQILQSIMDEKGMTVAAVARVCGLSDGTVRSIVTRKQKNVALEVAFKLSDGLGVSLERLNGMPEKESPSTAEAEPREEALLEFFRQLNEEGQDKVVDYVDDLVQSGKYIKSSKDPLAKEA